MGPTNPRLPASAGSRRSRHPRPDRSRAGRCPRASSRRWPRPPASRAPRSTRDSADSAMAANRRQPPRRRPPPQHRLLSPAWRQRFPRRPRAPFRRPRGRHSRCLRHRRSGLPGHRRSRRAAILCSRNRRRRSAASPRAAAERLGRRWNSGRERGMHDAALGEHDPARLGAQVRSAAFPCDAVA